METPPHDNTNHLHTARRQTRSALSEIPVRLGMLAVTDGGTTLIEETQTTPLNTRFLHGDMWNFNLPPSYLTPSPSPDELVIQQRGRRRVPLTFSPDIDTQKEGAEGRNTRDCTPVKNNGSSSPMKYNIVRRNTPRKRLVLNDPKEMIGSPEKNKTRPSTSPNAKKIRVERTGFSCSLQAALKGLSQEQLIGVIQNLVEKHPGLESEMKVSLPPPDLKPLEERLNHLKKNIFKSLPNSRLSSKTDSAAYTRAATHVTDFKKCVLDQGRTLLESQHWDSVMEYVLLAWTYVRATPLWDNPLHNTARRQCFKFLASQCMTALKKGAWSEDQASILKTKIEALVVDSEDVHSCLKQLESICF